MVTNRVEQAQEAQATRPPATPLGRLGSWSMRHRWLVVAGWVLLLAVMTAAGRLAGSQFKTGSDRRQYPVAAGRGVPAGAVPGPGR